MQDLGYEIRFRVVRIFYEAEKPNVLIFDAKECNVLVFLTRNANVLLTFRAVKEEQKKIIKKQLKNDKALEKSLLTRFGDKMCVDGICNGMECDVMRAR
ncbi:hypothetical protein TSAR_015635 [Trichomalopsis sarcophagae]|uniref:Uncharacterized protein n=1 Tax=Trichomalopsis sarcophagae TaxID=543379 RepID=A0A232EG59_9HYME|nr:hypothetical protein TSAR_015635 [Trichomalopsis sarcophagae]